MVSNLILKRLVIEQKNDNFFSSVVLQMDIANFYFIFWERYSYVSKEHLFSIYEIKYATYIVSSFKYLNNVRAESPIYGTLYSADIFLSKI